jgi:activating signal cointegrator 1
MAKAFSLLQPWASLVVDGLKKNETRSYRTHYRGQVFIHASKRFNKDQLELMNMLPFSKYLEPMTVELGAIIGSVDIVDCITSEEALKRNPSKEELAFGDYSAGRFIYVLENPIRFANPMIAKGSLSLWNIEIPEDLLKIMKGQ